MANWALRFLLVSFISAVFGQPALAFLELNSFYSSEALNLTSATTSSRMLIDVAAGFGIDKDNKYNVGWNYSMHSTSDSLAGASATTYSSTQMGPRFLWSIDKSRKWSVGLGYYLVSQASYSNAGATAEQWKGTALKFDFAYGFPVTESILIGLQFNYSQATYTERLVGSTTYSNVSYSKTLMYPSIHAVWYF